MSKEMIKLAKEVINLNGNISNLECTHICKDCILSRRKNNDITCCMDTPENYLKIAKEYLESVKPNNEMIELAKQTIKFKGNVTNLECTHICEDCIFSSYNNKNIPCPDDTKENYVKIAKEYLESVENEDIPNVTNENVNMDDFKVKFDDELLEKILNVDSPGIEVTVKKNEDVKVERKMSLKEKILAKIDYKKIAEEVFDILEDEIVQEVADSFDEMEIAYDLIDGYRSDFIETAREVIVENIGQEINVDDVSDHLKEIAVDKIDEL